MMKKKPNVILILTDDQGCWAMGCAGNKEIRTPNIDRLAKEGVRFENFFCTSPVCSPARASILTGKMPSQHGVLDWIRRGNELGAEDAKDFPIEYLKDSVGYTELMAKEGYVCGISGKWHLGATGYPQKGYSHWFVTLGGQSKYIDAAAYRGTELIHTKGYLTEATTDDALSFIDERCAADDGRPFYLNLTYNAPHSPLVDQHKKEYVDYYLQNCDFSDVPQEPNHPGYTNVDYEIKNSESCCSKEREFVTVRDLLAGYYAAVQGVDDGVGSILDKLEEKGIRDNTLIVFMSDNGYNCGQHGIWGKGNMTNPMNMFDTSVKVPCIFNMPGTIRENVVSDALLSAYDFMPTLLDLLKIENPEVDNLPGRSFLPILLTETEEEYHESITVYDEYGPVRMVRTKEWKYVHRYPYGFNELYDLVHDKEERFNLLAEYRCFNYSHKFIDEKASEMRKMLETWFIQYADPKLDGKGQAVCGFGQRCRVGENELGELAFVQHSTVSSRRK